jgi:hypothetical protein
VSWWSRASGDRWWHENSVGYFNITTILYVIFHSFSATAGWIAVGVWTFITLLGLWGEWEYRKLAAKKLKPGRSARS